MGSAGLRRPGSSVSQGLRLRPGARSELRRDSGAQLALQHTSSCQSRSRLETPSAPPSRSPRPPLRTVGGGVAAPASALRRAPAPLAPTALRFPVRRTPPCGPRAPHPRASGLPLRTPRWGPRRAFSANPPAIRDQRVVSGPIKRTLPSGIQPDAAPQRTWTRPPRRSEASTAAASGRGSPPRDLPSSSAR